MDKERLFHIYQWCSPWYTVRYRGVPTDASDLGIPSSQCQSCLYGGPTLPYGKKEIQKEIQKYKKCLICPYHLLSPYLYVYAFLIA